MALPAQPRGHGFHHRPVRVIVFECPDIGAAHPPTFRRYSIFDDAVEGLSYL